jgi:hypothetical protein
MANTIAYTSSAAPTGSLKSGVISINLNDQIIGQNYNWRNGIVFSNQYIIYSDTYTQGIDTEANAKPCAWACDYNNGALLNLINTLPPRVGQTPYTTLSDAIAWLQGQNKYFIVNQNYPTIVTDSLELLYDTGLTGSYPTLGTTFYDVSGNGNNGSIDNSPTFFNSGATSYFAFDGTDDTILSPLTLSDLPALSNFTLECWALLPQYPTAPSGVERNGVLFGATYYAGVALYWRGNSSGNGLTMHSFIRGNDAYRMTNGSPMALNRYYHFVLVNNYSSNSLSLYVNGTLFESIGTATQQYNAELAAIAGPIGISRAQVDGGGTQVYSYWNGRVSKSGIYTRALSASEIAQNAYLGPISTTNLTALYDSGNIASYPGSLSTWYDIKGTDNGTINNGVYYTINEGGILNFDGTDDYVQTSSTLGNLGSGDWTFSVWWKANGTQSDYVSLISQGFTGGISSGAWALKVKNSSVQNFISFSYASGFETINDVVTSANANDGNWHNIVVKRSVNTCTLYMDGQSVGTFNVSGGFVFGTGAVTYIGFTPRDSAYILGNLGIIQKYTRALSDGEIIQNYGVYRNRFETNQAFATGGVVSTVIENGIRYRVHTFTSSGTLTVTNAGKMEVLCAAGGGAGGYLHGGGGGGAGGVIYNPDYSVTTGSKTITIGAGGVGGFQLPTNGTNSVMDTLTAIGGGAGGSEAGPTPGANGGSGGGGSGYSTVQQGGTGTSGQGGSGGKGGFPDTSGVYGSGGGGGGARQDGGNGKEGINVLGSAGNGGNGLGVNMTGTTTYYGGGGGGGYWGDDITQYGVGGLGGGGNGGAGTGPLGPNNLYPTDGQTNTGGGGGGSRGDGAINRIGASGGSGIVIVRYRI